MSIKLTAKEVTDRVTSNKNCIISYYPHPHSPPEKSELKRLVAKRKAAAEAVAQAQEATAAGGGGMLPSRLKITSRAVRKEGSEVEALAERDKARRGRGSGRSGPGG